MNEEIEKIKQRNKQNKKNFYMYINLHNSINLFIYNKKHK